MTTNVPDDRINEITEGEKIDAAYRRLFPDQEHPGEFRVRMLNGQLTDDQQQQTEGMDVEEAFVCLYPDYVSLHDWREVCKTALTPKPSANPAPVMDEDDGDGL